MTNLRQQNGYTREKVNYFLSPSKNSNYYFLIPEKVSILLPYINDNPPQITGFCLDYLKEILSIISIHTKKDNEGANLVISYLRKIVPHSELYIKHLIATKIIERDNVYKVGEKSYTYKFTPAYFSHYVTSLVTNQKLINRIKESQRYLEKKNSRKYTTQNEFIRKITIDKRAWHYIETTLRYDELKYNSALASITAIHNKEFFYSVDKTSGRYHSNLTNLPSELRKFIKIDGKYLANIDIKNSQPYFSILLLTDPQKVAGHAKSKNLRNLLKSLPRIDAKLYTSLVISGKLYEYLWAEFNKAGLNYETRKEVKKQLFIILFGRNEIHNKQREIFAGLFPSVWERFCEIKGSLYTNNRFDNYKRFAILLQRIESNLILDVILEYISKEYPETIAVTIHDSVMTSVLTNDIINVKKVMEKELTEYVGFMPTLKIEKNLFTEKDTYFIQNLHKEIELTNKGHKGYKNNGYKKELIAGYQYDVRNAVTN